MADYADIPTLKENIDRETVDSVLALDVDKLSARRRTQAVQRAKEEGLIP